jgi:hypothetical protein
MCIFHVAISHPTAEVNTIQKAARDVTGRVVLPTCGAGHQGPT